MNTKQMKQLIALIALCAVGVVIWVFVYRDDGVDVANRIFPEGMDTKEKCLLIQKHWLAMEKMDLDSASVTNLISNLVKEKGSHLSNEQKIKLSEKLTSWLFRAKTGKFEDWLAFREPDNFEITESDSSLVAYYLAIRKPEELPEEFRKKFEGLSMEERRTLAKEMTDEEMIAVVKHLSILEKARHIHDRNTNFTLSAIRAGSIHFNVRNWKMKASGEEVMSSRSRFDFYPGPVWYDLTSIAQYEADPREILKKHSGVEWARFRAGYDSPEHPDYIFSMQLALYWDPKGKRWIADFFSKDSPSMKVYDYEGRTPNIYF